MNIDLTPQEMSQVCRLIVADFVADSGNESHPEPVPEEMRRALLKKLRATQEGECPKP